MGNGVQDSGNPLGELPRRYWHMSQKYDRPQRTDDFGIDLTADVHRWENWIVKLTFEKQGNVKHGNGFYVNVPNATNDVVLTAAHNLVDGPQHYCSNIKIIHDRYKEKKNTEEEEEKEGEDIEVTPDMLRVCTRYFDEPNEDNAIYDYGAILLKRDRLKRIRGFGFHIMLGLVPPRGLDVKSPGDDDKDVMHDKAVNVSGYRPEDSPPQELPKRSEGRCVRAGDSQLQYNAQTVQGMSGGPVWVGYRGKETVVAIHNYGAAKDGEGNQGTRLNLKVWRTIFDWVGVGWYGKSLHYRGSKTYSMHLYLPPNLPPTSSLNRNEDEGRVRVGKPGQIDSLFDIFPVAMVPGCKEKDAYYGFILKSADAKRSGPTAKNTSPTWARWDPSKNKVTPTKHFDARCEVNIPQVIIQPGKPFEIQARDGKDFKQVKMSMELLDKEDLELLGDDPTSYEDTSEISFVPVKKNKAPTSASASEVPQ
ncbi:uncharacterized protein GGS25DRAFT_528234 [Hypoxylon fragiforme]|uniref:uncharacterized protein n=1 Tax=Hypoxylon fragiforme TaxID=63214 RepID=UPI0020C5D9D4|nr:uncharacterized protein GGS25DRAFT_528234 [Hypoxylon fragiforme]KAI2603194.1 hypothetical protein GGS25DRAFT_528234 [Hypoxylon fragiforme]